MQTKCHTVVNLYFCLMCHYFNKLQYMILLSYILLLLMSRELTFCHSKHNEKQRTKTEFLLDTTFSLAHTQS